MKYLVALILVFSSCSHQQKKTSSLDFETASKIVIGATKGSDVEKLLGSPDGQRDIKGFSHWDYNDSTDGLLKLTIAFAPEDGTVAAYFWLMRDDDKYSQIDGAKAFFKNAQFTNVQEDKNAHYISNTYALVDEVAGVKIRYQKSRGSVESISIHAGRSREPSASDRK